MRLSILVFLSFLVSFSDAFVIQSRVFARPTQLASSSREEEIARLEEQLRKLREDEEGSNMTSKEIEEKAEETMIALEKVKGKSMLLSEAELIDQDLMDGASSGGGLPVTNILAAVGALVFLLLFSQIPVGQEDLSRMQGATSVQKIDLGDMNPDITRD